jgi:hypothetical protein
MLNLVCIVTTELQGVKTVPVADSVIDLTADSPVSTVPIDLTPDSPVSTVPITERTDQSVVSLDDTIDISSPVKQAR